VTSAAGSTTTPSPPTTGFRLSSSAFTPGGPIPATFTCDGADVSPPLKWSGTPPGARELVLVMRDPDAPGGDFVHWAVAGISPGTTDFPSGGVPGLITPGKNSFGSLGYRGPCPPQGTTHHYVITLTALSAPSGLRPGFSADQLHAPTVATATLTGTYARH
jgi:Raf kinase inhibitor-like YbhB/YbcL family protein